MNINQPNISLTPAAIAYVKKIINRDSGGKIFRLSVKTTGCSGFSYVPAIVNEPNSNDIQLQQDGLTFYVDPRSLNYLNGTILDLIDKGLGQQHWSFSNPNITGTCGCGESFSIRKGQEE